MLTRRSFFKTAGLGAAVAASANFPNELLAWAEPPRAPQPGGLILLNSNENAYGPFPSVLAMGNPFREANRYPDHRMDVLGEKLAALNKVSHDQLVTGCGSSEILRMAACAFTGPGRKLIMAAPTFESIGHYAEAIHAEVVRVPLAANFTHDLGAMLKAAGPDAGLVYICNPNNPTANLTPRKDLEDFISRLPKNTMVLMDEAYHDFVGDSPDYVSFIEHPIDDDRVIVARTFSKIYGLAGMRLGYGVGSKAAIRKMSEHRLSDPLNTLVIRCAMVSLDDAAGHQQARQRNAADRDEFMRQIAARKLTAIPSSANFVMVHTGKPIRGIIDHFRKNNIAIGRPFPPLDTYARISLGKPEEMKEFWRAWDMM
ncbi:MAG: aminotransferase class I/II-fold pyridoxal phosphate-dependent enzyme [Acidobacteriia bacterium]|nr:aminotransferase class I/II-fold pyridoxal phosphate-dependent enzyme [Terriglobia bacterium]